MSYLKDYPLDFEEPVGEIDFFQKKMIASYEENGVPYYSVFLALVKRRIAKECTFIMN